MNKLLFSILLTLISTCGMAKNNIGKNVGPNYAEDFSIDTSGNYLFASKQNFIITYHIGSNKPVDTISYPKTQSINKICLSADAKTIASIANTNILNISNTQTKKNYAIQFTSKTLTNICINKTLNRIAVGTKKGTIYITDTLAHIKDSITYHKSLITGIDFSNDGLYLASSSMGGKAIITNLYTKKKHVLLKQRAAVRCITFNNESNKVLASADNKKTFQWRLMSEKYFELTQTKKHLGWITFCDFNRDATAQIHCSTNGRVEISTYMGNTYKSNFKSSMRKVQFLHQQKKLIAIVQTFNKQLILINALQMNQRMLF